MLRGLVGGHDRRGALGRPLDPGRLAVVRPWWRRQSALAVHAVSLVVASAVLFSQLPGQWFFFDEFEYLGSSRDQYAVLANL